MTLSTTGIPTVRPPKRRLFEFSRLPKIALALAAAGFFVIFFLWPLLDVVLRSVSVDGVMDWGNPQFTFEHYLTILQDEYLHLVEWRTIVLAVNSTVLALLLGFPAAYFISRLPAKAAGIVLLLVLIPFQVSIVVRLFAVTSILSPNGLLSQASQAMGGERFSLLYTQGGTLVGTVMYLLPYMVLILYSGMTSVDHNVILAARTMGASGVQIFFKVFLPLVRTSILSAALLCFILALSFFIVPAILGGPREQTVAVYIQQQIDLFQWGVASALGVVLLLATLILYVAVIRIGGGFQAPDLGAQAKGVSAEQRFTWTPGTVVTGAITLVSLAVLLIPVLIVFPLSVGETQTVVFPPRGFTLEWYGQVLTTTTWLDPTVRSLLIATLTGLVSTSLALYIGRGAREISFTAETEGTRFFLSSAVSETNHPTTLIPAADALTTQTGEQEHANRRTVRKHIHEDGALSSQLVLGITAPETGNVWNSMPPHTHDRRTEVYVYFDLDENERVFHFMGLPGHTRHMVLQDGDVVISPSWSMHFGVGTTNYSFLWVMAGENQSFADMDQIAVPQI